MFEPVGRAIASYLSKPVGRPGGSSTDARLVAETLAPGDVLLVDGNTRMSAVVKYLTQSPWSHAALYVGRRRGLPVFAGEPAALVEADLLDGVRAVPLSRYLGFRLRICRPVKLSERDRERVIEFVIERLGYRYDLKNVWDLARYLLPLPVPARFRRRLITFGSGDPTRAVCSTLIAQAFGAVRYPILPIISRRHEAGTAESDAAKELWRIRHHSLYVPRDFDMSPFFEVIKPRIAGAFDYHDAPWSPGGTVILGDYSPTEIRAVPHKKDAHD
ncbi:MAG TPA: YiiX/YebB-like N1pC/P60 family cysteine hydrolase [Burkholderiaceae bacterium]